MTSFYQSKLEEQYIFSLQLSDSKILGTIGLPEVSDEDSSGELDSKNITEFANSMKTWSDLILSDGSDDERINRVVKIQQSLLALKVDDTEIWAILLLLSHQYVVEYGIGRQEVKTPFIVLYVREKILMMIFIWQIVT